MNIAVLLGSPCGAQSVTLLYVEFLRRRFPTHRFDLLDIGRGTLRLARHPEHLDALIARMAGADALLWGFPVYTTLTPAAMVRFIELLFERGARAALEGKPCTALSTSEHFFDHTAHDYIEAISEDLGMRFFRGYSAAMEGLLDPEGQRNLGAWFGAFLRAVSEGAPLEHHSLPVCWEPPAYTPGACEPQPVSGSRRVTLITDLGEDEPNLARMIEVFVQRSSQPVDILNLREIDMRGSCMGCLQCVYDGSCVYKDGFARAFDERILGADVLVFAGTIRHRWLSSHFKTYFDRNFRNGHRPVLHGKPVGWLISGPLRQLASLRSFLESVCEIQHSPRLGIVTDEYGDHEAITARIAELAAELDRQAHEPWGRPATFLGVGGRKIFRDLMYAMRGLVRADHRYYRSQGLYDFPQSDHRRTLFNWLMAAMMAVPWSRRWLMRNMGELKLKALRGVVDQLPPPAEAQP